MLCATDGEPRTVPELVRRVRNLGLRRVTAGQAISSLLQLTRSGDVARHDPGPYAYTLTPAGERRREASRAGLSPSLARTLLALDEVPVSGAEVARRVQAEHGGETAVTYAPLYRLVALGLATRTPLEFGDGYARTEQGEACVRGARLVMRYVAEVAGGLSQAAAGSPTYTRWAHSGFHRPSG